MVSRKLTNDCKEVQVPSSRYTCRNAGYDPYGRHELLKNRRTIFCMLSNDRRKILCDMPECGKEAVGGCEERIEAGHGGDRITIPGGQVAWCESHEKDLLERMGRRVQTAGS
jgi:hypothetical protein